MNTDNNDHESTTQVGNPYLAGGGIPPPPPPEWSMHQRKGAVLAFLDTSIDANKNQWLWEGIILQGSC